MSAFDHDHTKPLAFPWGLLALAALWPSPVIAAPRTCKCGDDTIPDLLHGLMVCRPPATISESLNLDWINEQWRNLRARENRGEGD